MIKRSSRILLALVLTLFVLTFSVYFLIVKTPRSIPYLSGHIEELLSDLSPEFDVKVADTKIQWDGLKKGFGFHIKDFKLLAVEGRQEVAAFPDIRVKLDLLSLILGNIRLKDLHIIKPEFQIDLTDFKDTEEIIPIKKRVAKPITIYRETIINILSVIEANNKTIPIENIRMSDVSLVLSNGKSEILWSFPEFSTRFLLVGNIVMFRTKLDSNISGRETSFAVEGSLENKDFLQVRTNFTDFWPESLVDVFPEYEWLSKVKLPLTGVATLLFDSEGKIKSSDFKLSNKNSRLKLNLNVSGNIDFYDDEEKKVRVPQIHMKANLTDLPMADLEPYWPPDFAADARWWVLDSLSDGVYKNANLEINITPEDFINKKLPDEAVKAFIAFENATVEYYSDLPKASNASGSARFNSNTMNLIVDKAKIDDSYIEDTHVRIYNLGTDDVKGEINGRLKGTIDDLIKFIALKPTGPETSGVDAFYNPDNINGASITDFNLKLPIYEDIKLKEITINAMSSLSNVEIAELDEGVALSGGKLNLNINNNGMTVVGDGYLNSIYSDIKYSEDFTDNPKYYNKYKVETFMTPEELVSFGLPEFDFISGGLGFELYFTNDKKGKNIVGVIDATEADIDVKWAGWKKPLKQNAILSFLADEKEDESLTVKAFQITSEDFLAAGNAELVKGDDPYTEINFSQVKFGDNDMSIEFREDKAKYHINAKGKSASVGPFLKHVFDPPEDEKESLGLDMKVDFEQVIFQNDVVVNDLKGFVKCGKKYCRDADFVADFEEGGDVSIKYALAEEGKRNLSVISDNLGMLLGGLGILKDIKGGSIELTGITSSGDDRQTEGFARVRNFTVVRAPILAKVLTVASFTGIVNLLNGKGIAFEKGKGGFIFKDNALSLVGAKASGASLGITVDGNISSKDLDLEGAVTPAYTINSFLGNIPLIGDALIGRSGEGLIAAKYKVTGPQKDPKVTVNPFSILTPGFLRNIWGGAPDPVAEPVQ